VPLLHRGAQGGRGESGASEAEMAETTFVAAALRAGASVVHGTHLLK
jgi:hypothetical protein